MEGVAEHLDVKLNSFVTVADVNKVKMYMKNFGEFYDDQISHASCIILSRTQTASEEKIAAAVAMLREKNPTATIVTTAWDSPDRRADPEGHVLQGRFQGRADRHGCQGQ